MQKIDFSQLSSQEAYKFLTGVIVPRPIAWVTTFSDNGTVNAAPFSFFNIFGSNPPIVAIGTGRKPEGKLKDTAYNLRERKTGVIHLVEEDQAQAMSETAAALPHGISELDHAGLEFEASPGFPVPSICGTRVRLHAKLLDQPVYGNNLLNILELVSAEIKDGLRDPGSGYIDESFSPIGRLAGNGYCRSGDRFQIQRPS